eukprot:3210070-Pyramimonas_sp.AAC.1
MWDTHLKSLKEHTTRLRFFIFCVKLDLAGAPEPGFLQCGRITKVGGGVREFVVRGAVILAAARGQATRTRNQDTGTVKWTIKTLSSHLVTRRFNSPTNSLRTSHARGEP